MDISESRRGLIRRHELTKLQKLQQQSFGALLGYFLAFGLRKIIEK